MGDTYEKILIHQWIFNDTSKTETERLTDTVGGVVATLGYNAELLDNGLYLSYGNANYMKAYASMPSVFGRSKEVEVDVLEFKGNWDSGNHGRFLMFDDASAGAFDEGLIFNATKQTWCIYDSSNGWDDGFSGLEKNAFSGKTVKLRVEKDGTTTLYLDDEVIGVSKNKFLAKNTTLGLGSSSRAATGVRITAVRVYDLKAEEFCTVRFLNKDKTDVISVQQVKKGGFAEAPEPPKEKGFIFIGWSTSFSDVQEDITVYPRYREIPPHPVLNFYKKNADRTMGDFLKSYAGVNACTISKKMDGECTIELKLLTRLTEGLVTVDNLLEIDGLIFNITEEKKNISSGMCYSQFSGEHISYVLNDDDYLVTAFDMTGTPKQILQVLLSGTPFTVGAVEFDTPVTLRVNQETTRRACVMQLLALVKGEIEYYGYSISIRKHIGSTSAIDIMKTSNVRDISYSYNATEHRYSFSIDLYQKGNLELGDEIHMKFKPLGINSKRRIVGMEWNPFNYNEVSITIGAYVPTLNDSLYSLIDTVENITEATAKYTVEFGEMIGNGSFYFTRAYNDRPYFHIHTSDGSVGKVTLTKKDTTEFSPYVGAKLSGVNSDTSTLLVFYCTVPVDKEDDE